MSIISRLKNKLKMMRINSTQESRQSYLRSQGAIIGNNTKILDGVTSFGSEPYLVSIGNDCLISSDVSFITHDGGMNVINNLNLLEEKMDKLRRIRVGDNVFIGKGAIIMGGGRNRK